MIADVLPFVVDCEAAVGRLWDQGANAWSSFAYVVVAVVIALGVRRHRLPVTVLVVAVATGVEGVGSVLFHGRSGDVAHALHDIPLFVIFGYMVGWHVGRLVGRPPSGSVLGAAVGLVGGGALWLIDPGSTSVIVGLSLVVIVVADLLARRRRLVTIGSPGIITLATVAVASWALGRSDSPLCEPESPLQLHALWHLLSALLILAWVDRACAIVDQVCTAETSAPC